MLVKDLLAEISSLPYHRLNQTNVSEVRLSPNGDIFLVTNEEEVADLKSIVNELEEEIKRMETEHKNLGEDYDKLEAENTKLFNQIAEINDGEISLKDLLEDKNKTEEQNKQLRKNISEWAAAHKELTSEIEKLRARKNKASVERCRLTGKLIAEFAGKKYYLETEIPAEKA